MLQRLACAVQSLKSGGAPGGALPASWCNRGLQQPLAGGALPATSWCSASAMYTKCQLTLMSSAPILRAGDTAAGVVCAASLSLAALQPRVALLQLRCKRVDVPHALDRRIPRQMTRARHLVVLAPPVRAAQPRHVLRDLPRVQVLDVDGLGPPVACAGARGHGVRAGTATSPHARTPEPCMSACGAGRRTAGDTGPSRPPAQAPPLTGMHGKHSRYMPTALGWRPGRTAVSTSSCVLVALSSGRCSFRNTLHSTMW